MVAGYHPQRKWKVKQNKTVYMHREIMGTPKGMDTDHIDRNGLDNRKCNLRICTRSQNNHNRQPRTDCDSRYKGVAKQRKRWMAHIQYNGRSIFLGEYDTEIEAAKAYDKKAKEFFGEFARPNIYN